MALFQTDMVSKLREQAEHIEKSGALSPEMLNVIYEYGLFKLFVPKELHGRMVTLPEGLRIFDEAAYVDGNLGWAVTIGSGGGFFSPMISPSVVEQVFAAREAVVAGSGHPSGTATAVEGGYLVRGIWKYCSGSTYATVFTANCMIDRGEPEAAPEIRAFVFWPDEVEIIKDWNSFGLKATESHSIQVQEVFVPEERTFNLAALHAYQDEPIYRFPFIPFAEASFAAVNIGICRHFLEEAHAIIERNRTTWDAANSERSTMAAGQLARAEMLFRQSASMFYRTMDQAWDKHVQHAAATDREWEQVSRQCKETASQALQCSQAIYPFLGLYAAKEDTVINRTYRDLHTARQHSLLMPLN